MQEEAKQIISSSKNIYLIPEEQPEAIASTLGIFYALKNLEKNVNLIIDNVPGNLKFLIPSLDYISYPKNFVISIPNNTAGISQVYYEKSEENLEIHMTVDRGVLKKEDVSFYYSEAKPDLIITVGVKDYEKRLKEKMNSFGFLIDSPILNIDTSVSSAQATSPENKNFGKINIIENRSLAEIGLDLVNNSHGEAIKKEPADCFLTGLIIYTENFKNNVTAEIFQIAAEMMKKGADIKTIAENLNKIS